MTWALNLRDDVIDARTANSHDHWRNRQQSAKAVRHAVSLLAKVALRHNPAPPAPVSVICTRWVTDRRHRDPDNTCIAWKPALDGLVDAGVIGGDCACYVDEITYRIRYRLVSEKPGWTIDLEPV